MYCGGKRPASLNLICSPSSVCLSLSVHLFAYLRLLCSLKDQWVQYWLQGYRHTHTNGVLCGKWLWSRSITLCCHCVVSLFISLTVLASSTWHSESFHPLHVALALCLTHTQIMQLSIVCGPFDVRTKAQQCLILSNVRENATQAFTVYARNGKRNFVELYSIEIKYTLFGFIL